jgi:hypothetical protein
MAFTDRNGIDVELFSGLMNIARTVAGMASIIMSRMFHPLSFLVVLAFAFFSTLPALAQTPPPGPPFDASKHPNPILTFVESKDFKAEASDQAKRDIGIDLLGLSQEEGKRESLDVADGRFVKNMSILSVRTDVTFYPVVRQRFKLTDGSDFVLYSFRFPKVLLPQDFSRIVLNEAALERKKKPAEMRFGGQKPETLEIRGARALLFEIEGQTTVYWQEGGVGHTATSSLPRKELFRVIEDLL